VCATVVERLGQGATDWIALTVGQFGLQDPRSAGADKYANARGAVALGHALDGLTELVLL